MKKLPYGEWRSWPEQEQRAIESFLMAWWRWELAQPAHDDVDAYPVDDTDDLLCGIAQALEDLTPYLNVWIEQPTFVAVSRLAGFVRVNAYCLYRKRLCSDWTTPSRPRMEQIVRWLREPRVLTLLEETYLAHMDADEAEAISEAADILRPLARIDKNLREERFLGS